MLQLSSSQVQAIQLFPIDHGNPLNGEIRLRYIPQLSENIRGHPAIPKGLPSLVRFLIKGLGDAKDSSELASYLLFDGVYTKKIIEVGYEDALRAKEELEKFFTAAAS